MEIRPEARTIMIAFARPASPLDATIQEQFLKLIDSLDALDSVEWQPLPLTALAQAYANAQVVLADPPFGAPDAVVNYLLDTPPAPLNAEWRTPLLTAVDQASEHYFAAARNDFNLGDTVSGTENLYHAANCAVIGQAALHGWPHATDDDDTNAVVALATGTLPQNPGEIYNLLQQAPSAGMDLSSNHGAVKSVRQAARLGYFAENGYTTELATSFAQAAAELAKRLGSDAL